MTMRWRDKVCRDTDITQIVEGHRGGMYVCHSHFPIGTHMTHIGERWHQSNELKYGTDRRVFVKLLKTENAVITLLRRLIISLLVVWAVGRVLQRSGIIQVKT